MEPLDRYPSHRLVACFFIGALCLFWVWGKDLAPVLRSDAPAVPAEQVHLRVHTGGLMEKPKTSPAPGPDPGEADQSDGRQRYESTDQTTGGSPSESPGTVAARRVNEHFREVPSDSGGPAPPRQQRSMTSRTDSGVVSSSVKEAPNEVAPAQAADGARFFSSAGMQASENGIDPEPAWDRREFLPTASTSAAFRRPTAADKKGSPSTLSQPPPISVQEDGSEKKLQAADIEPARTENMLKSSPVDESDVVSFEEPDKPAPTVESIDGELGTDWAGVVGEFLARIDVDDYYPAAARRRRQQGTVLLRMDITGGAQIGRIVVAETSRYALLDQAAVALVQDHRRQLEETLQPYSLRITEPLRLSLPVRFRLR